MPYTFLDDAPLEERRTRAVQTRRARRTAAISASLDADAIAAVRRRGRARSARRRRAARSPCARRSRWRRAARGARGTTSSSHSGRASTLACDRWVATERRARRRSAPYGDDDVATSRARRRLHADRRARRRRRRSRAALALPTERVDIALARLEADGRVLQGSFTGAKIRRVVRARPPAAHSSPHHRHAARAHAAGRAVGVRALPLALAARHAGHAPARRRRRGQGDRSARRARAAARRRGSARSCRRACTITRRRMLDELCLSGEVAWARLRVTPPEGELNPRARAGAIGLFARTHARLAHRSLRAHRRAGVDVGAFVVAGARRRRGARAARRRLRRRSGGGAVSARCPRSRTRCGSWRAPAPSPATASPACARCSRRARSGRAAASPGAGRSCIAMRRAAPRTRARSATAAPSSSPGPTCAAGA